MNDLTVSIPELSTPRLRIAVLGPAYATDVLEYRLRNQFHFRHNAPPVPGDYFSREYWESRLRQNTLDAVNGSTFRFFFISKPLLSEGVQNIVGDCSLANIVRGAFQACHLGYNLDESHVGKGLMQEALTAVIAFAFDTLLLHRVMANHLPDNHRSAKTLAALGFETEGLAKDYLFLGGAWRDHVLTSKINPRPIRPLG